MYKNYFVELTCVLWLYYAGAEALYIYSSYYIARRAHQLAGKHTYCCTLCIHLLACVVILIDAILYVRSGSLGPVLTSK